MKITNKLTSLVLSLLIMLSASAMIFLPTAVAHADAKAAVCEGAGLVVGANGCSTSGTGPDVESTVQRGLNIFSAILGIIAVIMFMVGGLKYMTAQGDSGQLNSAKNTLIYAAVGLVIVMLSQTVIKFVLERFGK